MRLFLYKNIKRLTHTIISKRFRHFNFDLSDVDLIQAKEFCNAFVEPVLNEKIMSDIRRAFIDQLNASSYNHQSNVINTKHTFMQDFATGKEEGQLISLLIGVNTLEIMMITIQKQLIKKCDKKIHHFNDFQKSQFRTDMLIALAAEFIIEYIQDSIPVSELIDGIPPIVIIYELPQRLSQSSIDRGKIVLTNKGEAQAIKYQLEVHKTLHEMLKCWGFDLKIKCIMSYGSACYHDKQWTMKECIAALSLDHGLDLCHLEKTESLNSEDQLQIDKSKPNVLLMSDLSNFGGNNELAEIATEFDIEVDSRSSSTPGKKLFRKFVSETYIGEIFRLMALKLIREHSLFNSRSTYAMNKPFSITSQDVAFFENWVNHEKKCEYILCNNLGYLNYRLSDLITLSYVAEAVTDRATRLIATVMAALAERSSEKNVGFVFLGNLVMQHRIMRNRLSAHIKTYTEHLENKSIRIIRASPESALRGASLFASRI